MSPETSARTQFLQADRNSEQQVLNVYTGCIRSAVSERHAFEAAVRIWRKLHPNASEERAAPAVATIISHKL